MIRNDPSWSTPDRADVHHHLTSQPCGPSGRPRPVSRDDLDILVIGAGVTGCGCALDAVTRGLRVGLVDARDFAAGTSSRSSKLFHGGLRYLEQLNFALVFEALKERSLALNKLAPHLAKPVPFLYPLTRPVIDRSYAGLGIGVYDLMGAGRGVPHHLRHLSRKRTLESFPSANRQTVIGSIRFFEGLVDDARHTMMIGRTAAHYGAAVATSTRVFGFLREADHVAGVTVRDLESGNTFTIRAKQTINATGVWIDELQQMLGGRGQFQVRASKGVHLVVPRNRINSMTGLITQTEKSLLFIIPWGSHWIIGTTDTDWQLDRAHPAASQADIDYLLRHANTLLADPLTRDDVIGVYAGLRPLLAGESDSTSKLSREHAVASPVRGLVMIAGGKYTTYRVMAKDAVDAAVRDLDQKVPESCTEDVPLLGADGYHALWNARPLLVNETGLRDLQVEHLLNRYGSLFPELLEMIKSRPELAHPLDGAAEYLKVEAIYAASHEGALHLDDILARRTRISIETWDRGLAAAPEVATLVAPILGWGPADVDREVEHYQKRVAAERESQAPAGRPVGGRRPPRRSRRPNGPCALASVCALSTIHPTRSAEPHTDCALGVRSRHALHDDRGMSDKPATVRDLIGAYLAEQCTVLIDSEAQLRAGEDVVHTTRVAVRRLRSTIRVFADLFDPAEADDLESELIWWATLLGEVRDLDILAERQAALLAALPPELMLGPVSSTIQTELATRRKRATDDLTRCVELRALPQADRPDPPLAKRSALHRSRRFTHGRDRGRHQDGEEEGAQAALHGSRGAAGRRTL